MKNKSLYKFVLLPLLYLSISISSFGQQVSKAKQVSYIRRAQLTG